MSYIEEAEKNVVKVAKKWSDAIEYLNALSNFGNKYCTYVAKDEFFNALILMRKAVYAEFAEAIAKCFVLSGVGGKEVEDYSKEMFIKAFDEKNRKCVLHFLDEHGRVPSYWKIKSEKELRAEAKKKIKEMKNENH